MELTMTKKIATMIHSLAHTEQVVQKVINFFDQEGVADAAGIRLGACARMRLEKLLREIQDEARI